MARVTTEKDTCQRYCRDRTRQVTELEEQERQANENDTEISDQDRKMVLLVEIEVSHV